jgi:hypothetical protein
MSAKICQLKGGVKLSSRRLSKKSSLKEGAKKRNSKKSSTKGRKSSKKSSLKGGAKKRNSKKSSTKGRKSSKKSSLKGGAKKRSSKKTSTKRSRSNKSSLKGGAKRNSRRLSKKSSTKGHKSSKKSSLKGGAKKRNSKKTKRVRKMKGGVLTPEIETIIKDEYIPLLFKSPSLSCIIAIIGFYAKELRKTKLSDKNGFDCVYTEIRNKIGKLEDKFIAEPNITQKIWNDTLDASKNKLSAATYIPDELLLRTAVINVGKSKYFNKAGQRQTVAPIDMAEAFKWVLKQPEAKSKHPADKEPSSNATCSKAPVYEDIDLEETVTTNMRKNQLYVERP